MQLRTVPHGCTRGWRRRLRASLSSQLEWPVAANRAPYADEIVSGKTRVRRLYFGPRPRCPDSTKITTRCYFRTHPNAPSSRSQIPCEIISQRRTLINVDKRKSWSKDFLFLLMYEIKCCSLVSLKLKDGSTDLIRFLFVH